MATVTGAMPVSDIDSVEPAGVNSEAAANQLPNCSPDLYRMCMAANVHPHCSGGKFVNDITDRCTSGDDDHTCWCSA
jgi:hypothetical protein